MKKILKKLTIAALFAVGFSFISCHDPIFENILNEVPLETNGIKGDITNIIKMGDYVYLTNGIVYKRPIDIQGNEKWERLIKSRDPKYWFSGFSANRISYIAAGDKLYGIATLWAQTEEGVNIDKNGKTLCYFDTASNLWKAVISIPTSVTPVLIFNDDTINKAYARFSDGSVYLLNNGSVGSKETTNSKISSCSNGNLFPGTCAHTLGAYTYYLSEDDNYLHRVNKADKSNEKKISLSVGQLISFDITSDTIIFGTSAGIAHISLTQANTAFDNAGTDAASVSAFTFKNNAKAIFTTSYECNPILVCDSTKTENNTIIFAGLNYKGEPGSGKGIYNNTGLYAYYPERGTWNKDGTSDIESEGN